MTLYVPCTDCPAFKLAQEGKIIKDAKVRAGLLKIATEIQDVIYNLNHDRKTKTLVGKSG